MSSEKARSSAPVKRRLPYTPPGHEVDGSCCEGPLEPPHVLDLPSGRSDGCICGPDITGEAPDERPDCPRHGVMA